MLTCCDIFFDIISIIGEGKDNLIFLQGFQLCGLLLHNNYYHSTIIRTRLLQIPNSITNQHPHLLNITFYLLFVKEFSCTFTVTVINPLSTTFTFILIILSTSHSIPCLLKHFLAHRFPFSRQLWGSERRNLQNKQVGRQRKTEDRPLASGKIVSFRRSKYTKDTLLSKLPTYFGFRIQAVFRGPFGDKYSQLVTFFSVQNIN